MRCAEPPNACAVRARLTYDTTALEAGALGAPLTFTDGSVRLPGWLELDAQDDGTVARLLTANHRPEAPAGLSPAQAPPAELAAAPAPDLTPTEALVTYRRSPASGGLMTAAAGPGGEETRLVEVPAGADLAAFLERLADDPDVLHVEPNFRVSLAPLPSDPRLHDQWGAFAVGAPAAWHTETGAGSAVVVAIVDSGVDPTHPELAGRLLPGYDFCADDTSDCRASDPDPGAYAFGNWHGTHVAGIVEATAGDGMGVVGVAPDVRLLPVKVFPDAPRGTTTVATLVAAVRWAAGLPVAGVPDNPNPARVINLSLGGEFQSRLLEQALAEVRARGVVVVAAAGNAASAERAASRSRPSSLPMIWMATGRSEGSKSTRSCERSVPRTSPSSRTQGVTLTAEPIRRQMRRKGRSLNPAIGARIASPWTSTPPILATGSARSRVGTSKSIIIHQHFQPFPESRPNHQGHKGRGERAQRKEITPSPLCPFPSSFVSLVVRSCLDPGTFPDPKGQGSFREGRARCARRGAVL